MIEVTAFSSCLLPEQLFNSDFYHLTRPQTVASPQSLLQLSVINFFLSCFRDFYLRPWGKTSQFSKQFQFVSLLWYITIRNTPAFLLLIKEA